MSVYSGSSLIKSLYYGSTLIMKAYYGSTLIYQAPPGITYTKSDSASTKMSFGSSSGTQYVTLSRTSGSSLLSVAGSTITGILIPSGKNYLYTISFDRFTGTSITSTSYLFSGATSMTSANLSELTTRALTNVSYMFNNCTSLVTVNLDNLVMSSEPNISYMFYGCTALTTISIKNVSTLNRNTLLEHLAGVFPSKTVTYSNGIITIS